MNHFNNLLKINRQERKISDRIPITHLNTSSIFEANNTMLGMVIKLEGASFITENESVLNQYKYTWHRALTTLDERFCVYVTVHRHKENTNLYGKFNSKFTEELNIAYHQQFNSNNLYANSIYLTVIYKGINSGKVAKGVNFINALSHKVLKRNRTLSRAHQIQQLNNAVRQLTITLGAFKPTILGESDHLLNYSEVLSFLGTLMNGGEKCLFKIPKSYPAVTHNIAHTLETFDRYPYGNLSTYLASKRIFFGKYIQFQGADENDLSFGAIITIKHYAVETASIMLNPLLQLDSEFIHTNSYAIEPKSVMLERIQKHIIKMHNVNDPAVSQIKALEILSDQLASDLISMGYHSNILLLLAPTILELETNINKAIKCYADAGFVAVREILGQEPAFWSQIPMNMKYNIRSSCITSENFVDFSPLHNYKIGYKNNNHLGSAVTLLNTPAKTPFFFNFHGQGNGNNPTKGHTIIIGGNGCGKTAFMCFMDAQLERYQGESFYFDRDRGAEIYIKAAGGYYARLSPDCPNDSCFNPLQLPDTPSNRQFNRELFAQFCKNNSEDELNAEIIEQLKKCVDYNYEHLEFSQRFLSNATKIIPINFPRWANLRRWLRAAGKYSEGEYAYLFDNPEDKLPAYHKMGFDLTHFLDREPAHIRTALMMYLCHRIDLSLKGQLVALFFDEGWQNLIDPYWKVKFQKWLPTLRKRNAFIVISTQSPSSVINSPIRGMMLDNVATQIYFANPQAKHEEYIKGFHLTEAEYETIATQIPEARIFLVKQEHDSTLCQLNLNNLSNFLPILSANTSSVNLLDEVCKQVGTDPAIWLSIFQNRYKELKK